MVEIEAINPSQQSSKNSGSKKYSTGHLKNKAHLRNRFAAATENYQVYLQVGAFSQHQNAESLQNRIDNLSLPYKIKIEFDNQQDLYKVKLGPFASVSAADALTERLELNQNIKAYVVVN